LGLGTKTNSAVLRRIFIRKLRALKKYITLCGLRIEAAFVGSQAGSRYRGSSIIIYFIFNKCLLLVLLVLFVVDMRFCIWIWLLAGTLLLCTLCGLWGCLLLSYLRRQESDGVYT
jgi:hypothetical protein